MKRMLSLLLALLLAFGLLYVPALAFTDDADIGEMYREAVAEMTRRGVLAGFEDGSFRPGATLTREQGAKIAVYLCLGRAAADALVCGEAPFKDVAADRWSAPYIAWCAARGIVNGYGDGCFGPVDPLTGDQYAKILLCAMSLGKDGHTYTGRGWYQTVRSDANDAGMYTGDLTMQSGAAISRAQAALLSLNAAKAAETGPQPTSHSGDILLPEVP